MQVQLRVLPRPTTAMLVRAAPAAITQLPSTMLMLTTTRPRPRLSPPLRVPRASAVRSEAQGAAPPQQLLRRPPQRPALPIMPRHPVARAAAALAARTVVAPVATAAVRVDAKSS